MVKGLGTVIYPVADLSRAKLWYSTAFRQQPYFDQPFYVGFNVGGYELGLHPERAAPGPGGGLAYWRVADIESAIEYFVATVRRLPLRFRMSATESRSRPSAIRSATRLA